MTNDDELEQGALLWLLWHHQGGGSPIGQPIRLILGMGMDERLTDGQVSTAKDFARRLLAAEREGQEGQEPLTACGFGDDDERWGNTVEEYVAGAVDSYDYDDLISGEPFTVDAQFCRSEQWRVVSVGPIKCERISPIAPNAAATQENAMQSTADTSIKYSPHRIESSAVDPIINEHLLRDQAADYDRRVAEAELRGMERCAQTAFDTTSDDPQPGNWNDACEHIYDLIRAEIARLRAEMDQPSDALAGKEGKS